MTTVHAHYTTYAMVMTVLSHKFYFDRFSRNFVLWKFEIIVTYGVKRLSRFYYRIRRFVQVLHLYYTCMLCKTGIFNSIIIDLH